MGMNSEICEATVADRGALGLIGLLLFAATLMVTITAAVAVSDYRGRRGAERGQSAVFAHHADGRALSAR